MRFFIKWLGICLLVAVMAGSASALFLAALDAVTQFRAEHSFLIYFLPVAGLAVGLLYQYADPVISRGNGLLIDEIHRPKGHIPVVMAPFILISTLVTHLFGGSAGREGTAVQMGGALADQLGRFMPFDHRDRQLLILCGVSAGFAAVFGTPLAGAAFALEVFLMRQFRFQACLPVVVSAFAGDYVCRLWGVGHTVYPVSGIPELDIAAIGWTAAAGVVFGLTAFLFKSLQRGLSMVFKSLFAWPPLRPVIGGLALVVFYFFVGNRYAGLGVPVIEDAFRTPEVPQTFVLKLLATSITLGAGFKGGEVTPLFFIGATLGSCLSAVVPLPLSVLAATGFVAVFAGAARAPLACTLMGMELFGYETGVYVAVACVVATVCSGRGSVYR